MTIDYAKLAEQTGALLNEMGKKAAEITVKGVTAEAWAAFIPCASLLLILVLMSVFEYYKFNSEPKNSYGEWKESRCWMFALTIAMTLFALCFTIDSGYNVILVNLAPEWAAIKAVAAMVRK